MCVEGTAFIVRKIYKGAHLLVRTVLRVRMAQQANISTVEQPSGYNRKHSFVVWLWFLLPTPRHFGRLSDSSFSSFAWPKGVVHVVHVSPEWGPETPLFGCVCRPTRPSFPFARASPDGPVAPPHCPSA